MSLPSSTEARGVLFRWDDSRLIASPTLHHFNVGGLPALFCEKRQKLFGLNATADCIWRGLAGGRTPAQVSSGLTEMGFAESEATAFVRDATISWLNAGQLTPREVLDLLAEPAAVIRHVRIHDLSLRIGFLGSASPKSFDDVFGHLSADIADPRVTLSVVGSRQSWFIFEEHCPVAACTDHELVPHLKAILTERYVSSVESAFLVHGALLAKHSRGLLICGSPGAGKTTLSVALAGSSYRYCSDDIVRIERDGSAIGVPFLPAVKTGAWPLVAPYFPDIVDVPIHRRRDGQDVRYLWVPISAEPRILSDIVMLAREPGVAASLKAVEPLEVLSTILESAFSASGSLAAESLKTFARAIEEARCHKLVYSDLPDAVAALGSRAHG
jgi:hypothetical protein